ncbi:MAG: FAD-binding protein [Candidatus Methanofastidiosia archaeon]
MKNNWYGLDDMNKIHADVMIVGGGIAALKAAIEARKHVDSVLMVTKGRVGKGGCSSISEGILNAPFDEKDSPLLYFNDIMDGSASVADESLVKVLSENAKNAVLSLEKDGVKFVRSGHTLSLNLSGGNSVARTIRVDPPRPGCGRAIPLALLEAARKAGVKFLEGSSVVKLFVQDKRAAGALAFGEGEFTHITFKSAVLATGGAGKLYKNTTNPSGIIGDGYFLAQDAGASLVDMEYVQFFPTVALSSYLVLPFVFTDGATLRNSNNERFIGKYDPKLMEKTTRDKMSRAIFTEVMEGRGIDGGIYISYKEVPQEILSSKYKKELDFFISKGIDLKDEPLLARPACHFFMGGIKIDSACRTDVSGLFACGECAGGTHGANRLAGNALTEALVFGEIAGKSASDFANVNSYLDTDTKDFIESIPSVGKNSEEMKMISELKGIMWENVGIIRDKKSINGALEKISYLWKRFEDIDSVKELDDYFTLRNSLHVAKAIALAALERKESRGAHYRSDYQEERPEWKKAIIIKEGFELGFEDR